MTTGWVALHGRIVGNPDKWETVYRWNGEYHPSKERAVAAGCLAAESDDFNVGKVEDGRLVWFGWMDEQLPAEDYPAVAAQIGWTVDPASTDATGGDAGRSGELLEHASEFRFKLYPEGHEFWDVAQEAVTVEWRGPGDRWAVCDGGFCFDVDGHREHESIPSEREDEFKARVRFPRDEAVRIAREVVVPQRRARYDRLVARNRATKP